MNNLKENLRAIGVDERVIGHKAFERLFSEPLACGAYKDGTGNVQVNDGEVVIYDENYKPLFRIQNNYLGLEVRRCNSNDSYKVEIKEDGTALLESNVEKNNVTNEFSKHWFNKDGLETGMELGFYTKNGNDRVITRRVSREANGYVVNASLREERFDEHGFLIPPNELGECHGYMNVDPRFATLLIGTGREINYDNAVEFNSKPQRFKQNDLESPEINDLLKQYIAASLNDPDEYMRWAEKYEQGLIISGDTVKMGR